MRIAVNGFGRIGRSVIRAALTCERWPQLEFVAINDIASLEICAYLFQYDSVFGRYPGVVETGEGELRIDGRSIPFSSHEHVDFGDVDLVLECTGKATMRAAAARHLRNGASKVLVSGPSAGADFTIVLGANEERLSSAHEIVSNASCTTNAIAPLARLIDDALVW